MAPAPRRSARNKDNSDTNVAVEEKVTIKSKAKAPKKKPAKATEAEEENIEVATNGKHNKVADEDVDSTPDDDDKVPAKAGKSANKKGAKKTAEPEDVESAPTDDKVSAKATKSANRKGAKKTAEAEPAEDDDKPPTKKTKSAVKADESGEDSAAQTIYEFKANNIEGEEISLEAYKGHVCIIVNVASKCGHTKTNYEQLVELHEKYSESKGLKILAFPCNQFGKQEPGDAQKICEFVEKRNVKFDMFDKIDVNGKNAHPLWAFLQGKIEGPKGNKIDWNFTKFVINKDGEVVERCKSSVKPLDMVEILEKYW